MAKKNKDQKPQIDFIRETDLSGQTKYYTHVNGYYADNSLTLDRDSAYERYLRIVQQGGESSTKTVLESNRD